MARKKSANIVQITDQSDALVEYAATAIVAAEQRRIETKPVQQFPLDEAVRAAVAELAAVPAKLQRKLVQKEAVFTVTESAIILMAAAESFIAAEPKKQLFLLMVAQKLMDSLQTILLMSDVAAGAKDQTDTVFQFKITIKHIQPAIWRRIQVPDCTLAELHEYLQAAFGWKNYHLHQFEIGDLRYSHPDSEGNDFDMDIQDDTQVMLSELLPKSSKRTRWKYEYDFGDSWWHEIVFEKFPAPNSAVKYPLCLEGERACPPEDCGGPWGYNDFLAAIADSLHKRHQEMLAWCGPFDPEAFDAKMATAEMRTVK